MRVVALLVLAASRVVGVGLTAQEDLPQFSLLAAHLRPRWTETRLRTDHLASDDFLRSVGELRLQKPIQRPVLLMIYSGAGRANQAAFEHALFQHPRLALVARVFVCVRLDVRRCPPAAAVYDGAVPRFVLFDHRGRRRADISMAGCRPRPEALAEIMARVIRGYGSMPLPRFLGRYRKLLADLVPLEVERRKLVEREAAAARHRGAGADRERARLRAERAAWAAKKKSWLRKEQALFRAYHRGKR